MKRNLTFIAAGLLLAGAGSFFAFGDFRHETLDPTALTRKLPAAPTSDVKKAPSRVTSGYDLWVTEVQSQFNDDTSFTFDEGPKRKYGTEISISGNKVKIKGLFDLWYDDVDKEYVLEGTYDQRTGDITIPVKPYDSNNNGIQGYVKAAEMYSLTTDEPYTLVVFAGNMDATGNLNTQEGLVFSMSDDMDRITSKTGFGIYAFDSKGNTLAFYDYYRYAELSLPVSGVALSSTVSNIDFSGMFVCNGIEQKATIDIFNSGDQTADVNVVCESQDISFEKESLHIASCERGTFRMSLKAMEAGRIDEDITFLAEGAEPVKVHVGVDVFQRPDYTRITKAGSETIKFDMSPIYPFVIEEIDGREVAVSLNKGDNTESWFTAGVDVPAGKIGIVSFKGSQENKQPNYFAVSLDGEVVASDMYSASYAPMDISNTLVVTEGKHLIGFSHVMMADWFEDSGIHGRAYVYDLDFRLVDNNDSQAIADKEEVAFDDAWYDKLSTSRSSSVRLYNLGKSPLKVESVEGDENFSGEVPAMTAAQGEYVEVPLTWTVNKVGETRGEITIHTSAGDYTVACTGFAKAIPEEYHKIIKNGDFSFDTDSSYPFSYNSARNYLYNSSSKADIDGIVYSWLDATFEIPEGCVGKLEWDALNDSELPISFMGSSSIVSGTVFTIDGEKERMIGGQGIDCGAADLYTPGELIFTEGRHTVRFSYKKTFNTPERVVGDDRLKLYELNLDIHSINDVKGYVTPERCDFKGIQYSVERDGHQTIGIINYTDTPFELLSWEAEGPFSVVDLSDHAYEGTYPMMVEYHPTKTGSESGSVTLHTTIGDYTVPCTANGIDLNRGGRVYYESFEYGLSDWLFEDFDGDGESWAEMSDFIRLHESQNTSILFGYQAYGSLLSDYSGEWDKKSRDNVMFSPEIKIPEDGTTLLQFFAYAKTFDANDTLEVLVGEDADTYIDLYEPVFEKNLSGATNESWVEYMTDISKYAGKTVRLAFRLKTPSAYNAYFYMIDDVLVTNSLVRPHTGVEIPTQDARRIVAIEYYTPDGKTLSAPVDGINIVLTRYNDGTMSSSKIMRNRK